jgi:hypothetical protein
MEKDRMEGWEEKGGIELKSLSDFKAVKEKMC